MAKKKIFIPVAMIKPLQKKHSHKELLHRPKLQIVKTRGLKMVQPCTPKATSNVRRQRGVLGVIKSAILTSNGKVAISLTDATTAAQVIAGNTKLEGDLVVITPSNKVSPAHLPDLSDLALLLKSSKLFIRWIICDEGGKDGCGFERILPNAVVGVVDPPSEIPATIEFCQLSLGDHLIKIPSYRNDFKLFKLQHPMYVSHIHIQTSTITSKILDGRKLEVKVQGSLNEDVSFLSQVSTRGLTYVVWNCRDMGRDTFLPLMRSVIELNMPDFMLLTETRVSVHMARLICAYLHPFAVYGMSNNEYEGGYVMLAFTKNMSMKLISSFPNEYSWAFEKQN